MIINDLSPYELTHYAVTNFYTSLEDQRLMNTFKVFEQINTHMVFIPDIELEI